MRKHDLGARWFFCRLPRPQPCIRLLCFPQAGGLTTLFHAWPELLPSAVEVLVAQLPGRERRRGEPLLTDPDVLTSGFVEALGSYLDRPIAIFGHSAGALIGFEVARRLQRQGQPPRHLFVSARRAPHLPSPDPPVHQMPLDVFLSGLERRCGPLPAAVRNDPELLAAFSADHPCRRDLARAAHVRPERTPSVSAHRLWRHGRRECDVVGTGGLAN